MGGAVAMQFAHDFPERTLGVVYRDGVATASWKQRRGLFTHLLGPIVPDLGTALDFLTAFATDMPDLALSRITSMAATAAPDIRLNVRDFANTLPVGAMLISCDYTAMAAAVGAEAPSAMAAAASPSLSRTTSVDHNLIAAAVHRAMTKMLSAIMTEVARELDPEKK